MNVWKRLVRLIKLRLKKRRPPEDPFLALQRDLQLMDERLQEVKRSSLRLGKSKIQLEHRLREFSRTIERYQERAREALRLGREDLAELALRNKHAALTTQTQLRQKIQSLEVQIQEFERIKEELINQIAIYKIKRDEMELTRSAAQAELAAQELRWGMNVEESLGDIQGAFRQLEAEIQQIQAQVEATRELHPPRLPPLDAQAPPSLAGENADSIASELEALRRELGQSDPNR